MLSDVTSPERKKNETAGEIVEREARRRDATYQIENIRKRLRREVGADKIRSKQLKRSKVIPFSELLEVKTEAKSKLEGLLKNYEDDPDLKDYDVKESY